MTDNCKNSKIGLDLTRLTTPTEICFGFDQLDCGSCFRQTWLDPIRGDVSTTVLSQT